MAAVIGEAEAREVLVVSVQDGEEVPVGHLSEGKDSRASRMKFRQWKRCWHINSGTQ